MLKTLCLFASWCLPHDPGVPPADVVRRYALATFVVALDLPDSLMGEIGGDDYFVINGTVNGYRLIVGTPLVLVYGPANRSSGPNVLWLPAASPPNRLRGEWVLNTAVVWPSGRVDRWDPYRLLVWDGYLEFDPDGLGQVLFYRERHFGPFFLAERRYPTAVETARFFATETVRFYDRRYVLKLGPIAFSFSRPDDVTELAVWYRR